MKRLIVGLLVLVGLLVAVDFGAAALAESAVSREMRNQIGLQDDPSVRINGFPFVTQALAGEYSSVDVSAARLSVGPLQEVEIVAQLRDVEAPLSQLLGSGPRSLTVREAEGTVRIGAGDLERLIGDDIDRLRIDSLDAAALSRAVEDGADPAVAELDPDTVAQLYGTVSVLGQETEVAAIASLELTDGRIRIVPRDVRLSGSDTALPQPVLELVRERFTVEVDPGSLPLQVTPTDVVVDDGVLQISGITRDLVLGANTGTPG